MTAFKRCSTRRLPNGIACFRNAVIPGDAACEQPDSFERDAELTGTACSKVTIGGSEYE
jgi:hypothetical protein